MAEFAHAMFHQIVHFRARQPAIHGAYNVATAAVRWPNGHQTMITAMSNHAEGYHAEQAVLWAVSRIADLRQIAGLFTELPPCQWCSERLARNLQPGTPVFYYDRPAVMHAGAVARVLARRGPAPGAVWRMGNPAHAAAPAGR